VKNIVGLSMCEGFNKWAAAGLSAYIGYEYRNFTLPDTIVGMGDISHKRLGKKKYFENNVLIGGQLIRAQGKSLHYNVDAEFVVAGEDAGSFSIKGTGELNLPVLKDTAQLVVNAYVKNSAPGFYYRHYHSKHAWWDKDYDKIMRTRIEGQLNIPHTKTKLTVSVENM
jgi:ribosomal protein L27